ncbi:hypothetical protein [Dactylosporangium sp. CA-139066]|uniref:hypothetical protein n=1 Tax=Dactylosporangium sp. CA-139066 TaxID=3239930 RepID=UPI003D8F1866
MTDQSPLAKAEEAKRRRDIGGEIGALMAGADALARQPWAPLRPGDVVLLYSPAANGAPALGQTYLGVDETDVDGHAMMREVSRTVEEFAEDGLASFCELWFEAGPGALTVIRAGAVVYGTPARDVRAGR